MKQLLLAICCALLSWNVGALELAGIQLADQAQVGNTNLQLNGAGIRTKFFLKIYIGALYLPQKQKAADAIIADEREHRMMLHMLRDMSSTKLLNALNDAIEANHTPAEMAALDGQLKQLTQIFEAVMEVKSGDLILLDYLPASGTQISVNGTVRGTISGAAFNRALLRIWLGNKPVQDDLKKDLLGG